MRNYDCHTKELYNVIQRLPEELSLTVLDYIAYFEFSNATNDIPKELTVKDKKDLWEKLEEGRKDFENGNICSAE